MDSATSGEWRGYTCNVCPRVVAATCRSVSFLRGAIKLEVSGKLSYIPITCVLIRVAFVFYGSTGKYLSKNENRSELLLRYCIGVLRMSN